MQYEIIWSNWHDTYIMRPVNLVQRSTIKPVFIGTKIECQNYLTYQCK